MNRVPYEYDALFPIFDTLLGDDMVNTNSRRENSMFHPSANQREAKQADDGLQITIPANPG
jgi:hypothetical protein